MKTDKGKDAKRVEIPDHWVAIRKGWEDSCQSIGEALVTLPPEALKTHALAIGATGSGKTVLLHHLIAQDLVNGHSIVVLDARGDLAKAVVELCARAGKSPEDVKFFDLREKVRPLGFNPLAGAGEPYYRALGVLDAVGAEWESLGPQTAEALRNAVLLLAEAKSTLTTLEPLFYSASVRTKLLASCRSRQVREYWHRHNLLKPDRQALVASPVLNKVSLLFATEGLRRLFGHKEPLDLAEHLDRAGSVTLVSLAVDETHGAGWMTGRMLLSAVTREIFARVDMAESMRNPVRLYVDEFEHFGMEDFESILAEGRRFKFSLVLAHQNLAQLSPKARSLILGNVGAKVVFRSSWQDAQVLNKDLTGDAKAFDLPSLPVGEAVLWKRGEQPMQIEVNAPLIDDVGSQSGAARNLLAQMRKLVPSFVEEPETQRYQPEPRQEDPDTDLEDWL